MVGNIIDYLNDYADELRSDPALQKLTVAWVVDDLRKRAKKLEEIEKYSSDRHNTAYGTRFPSLY